MATTDTKKLRINYNNVWPARFNFPIEDRLLQRLASQNLAQAFVPAPLAHGTNTDFHLMLSAQLDALDMLPLRPDKAFESIWSALDAEMFELVARHNPKGSPSRFEFFMQHLQTNFGGAQSLLATEGFLSDVPMQSCEYAALRIIEAMNEPGDHSEYFIKKVKPSVGASFLDDFDNKFGSMWVGATPKERGVVQRKAGGLIRKVLLGQSVTLNGNGYQLTASDRLRLFVCALLPNIRNERFHGLTFSSYRSSAAKMKNYAHGYFVFLIAYFLLLHVYLYRGFGVILPLAAQQSITNNISLYKQVFAKYQGE